MIYTYSELKNNGLDNYNINKKVANKELYKIEIVERKINNLSIVYKCLLSLVTIK